MTYYVHILNISILFSFFFINHSIAQKRNFSFESLSVEQGLSQSSVLSICQDSRGFLWIGTEDGLNKYDGYKFTVFKNIPNDSTSIGDSRVNAIIEDRISNLWIGTSGGGLNMLERHSGKFRRYKNIPSDPTSLSNNVVLSICEDSSGILWVGTMGGGLNKFNPNTESFTNFMNNANENTSISNNIVYAILEDSYYILWVGTWGGLNRFIASKNEFIRYINSPSDINSLSNDKVFSLYEDKSKVLWVGTWGGGLNIFNRNDENFTRFNQHTKNLYSKYEVTTAMFEDPAGDFWIGTFGEGIFLLNKWRNYIGEYSNKPDNSLSLSNNRIYRIIGDRLKDIIWVGTVGGGLNKIDRRKEKFNHYTHHPNDPKSLSDNGVFAFCEDSSGLIWIGTYGGGLNCLDRKSNQFKHFKNILSDPNSLSDNRVSSILERKSGELWIGTFAGGLNKFEEKTYNFIHFRHSENNPATISDDKISVLFEDSFGTLWIGTVAGGLNRYDEINSKFISFKNDPNDSTTLSHNRIYTIFEDKNKTIWIGTFGGGLNKLNRKTEDFTHYIYDPENVFSLSNNKIYSIFEDKSGHLWIGTVGGGLNKFDRERDIFYHYREEDGLTNDVIYGILEDDHGNLWLSTNKGLSRFNINEESFKNFDLRDGLQHDEFNQGAAFKNKSGEMFFGGINGFNIFHPDSIRDCTETPEIAITSFHILNKPVSIGFDSLWNRTILEKSISETEVIELNYDDNVFSIEFAALDFRNPEKNKYAYIMEGFNEEWIYSDASRRFVTYTNLDPGEYLFRIKGSNADGIWNEEGASLKFIIHPPLWATWWAYVSYCLIFIITFVGSTRFYLNRQRLKQQLMLEHDHAEKLEEMDHMKSRFFANISHEFRTPLTLILGPAENIAKRISSDPAKEADLIARNSKRLLQLVNQLLDLSKLDAGKLEVKMSAGNIVSFIRGISLSFESLSESKDIMLKIKSNKEFIEVYFDKEKMIKVLTNLLSNSFKFSPEGAKVLVTIEEKENNYVEIKIRNTGIGIPNVELLKLFDRFYQVDSSQTKEYEGSGIGLSLTKELVELHHGTITVESKERDKGLKDSAWIQFTINLPLGITHLKNNEIVKPKIDKPISETEEEKLLEQEITLEEEDYLAKKTSNESKLLGDETKLTILVVEDNYDMREYIKESLSENYSIEEAINGEQGIRIAKKIIPDLIISDLMMPKMDGKELTRVLKNDELTSHVPIIMLTAKSGQESRIEGLQTGADDYLTKPFDLNELQIRVENLINIRKKLQEKFSKGEFLSKKPIAKNLKSIDEKFLRKVIEIIEKHLSEEEFSIEEFSNEVGMSRHNLHKKLKALVGKSPSLYVRSVRLHRAKELIEEGEKNISEIAYNVGFSSPAYFSRCFKEEFGYPPSNVI
jgi:signal transduction histidine kinase/ligand-binding sensor domain-containing protein/DNA-binding response OmpR family regulator